MATRSADFARQPIEQQQRIYDAAQERGCKRFDNEGGSFCGLLLSRQPFGDVEKGDLDFLSDDLNFEIEDVHASMNSFQAAIYHRSYIGLDNRGRIGLFSDISLGYTNSKTVFTYNEETADTYARSNQLKLSLHPGIVIFAMNNVSTHISMGIGGVSFNNTKYIKAGETIGKRNYSKANFKLDVLDISIGVTIHL